MKRLGIITGILMVLAASNAQARLLIIQQMIYAPDIQFVSSSPGANQGVNSPPQEIVVTFNGGVNPQESDITVYDPYGNKLALGSVRANGTSMSAAMPRLENGYNGVYHVVWKAVSQCPSPRTINGDFYFHIQ